MNWAAPGLPHGTGAELVESFSDLAADDTIVAVAGPSISDNTLLVVPVADEVGLPCINYTGGERTRSHWMFHYQVGSLEEEPILLADHVAGRRAAVVYDASIVGRRYVECFEAAGANVAARAEVDPVAEDLAPTLRALHEADPEVLVYLGLGVASRPVAVAREELEWDVPVVANSSLMFGYARRDWRAGFEGWVYVDTISDANPQRQALAADSKRHAASPIGCAAYDIGRLLGTAITRAGDRSRPGIREALEGVKRLKATSGKPGTTMGFGVYDHGALKGEYLVLRTWRAGHSVEFEPHHPEL